MDGSKIRVRKPPSNFTIYHSLYNVTRLFASRSSNIIVYDRNNYNYEHTKYHDHKISQSITDEGW